MLRRSIAIGLLLASGMLVSAQSAAPAAGDTAALPGDTPMPSLEFQLHKALGPAAGTPAQNSSPRERPALPLELALEAAQAAISTCAADGYRIGVAVIDADGQLLVGLSDDGAAGGRVYVALRKALTAAAFKTSTLELRAQLLAAPERLKEVRPNMSLFAGGVPLMAGARAVGAIAASGSTGNQDDFCARRGAEKIQSRLK